VLADVLPGLQHLMLADGGGAIAQGPVEVDVGAGCFEAVDIKMTFSIDYPPQPPTVYDHGRRWRPDDDRHLMDDHSFCLWLPRVDTPKLVKSEDLRAFALRLLTFLRDQFVFDDLGRWPGRDWPHGRTHAYAEHVAERLSVRDARSFDALWSLVLGATARPDRACPCGSHIPYWRCHRDAVRDLAWIKLLRSRGEVAVAVRGRLA
jgi:hypothetical protein